MKNMKIGTKSILFGVHQIMIHPLFVALAWWKLYGFPFDPRLWVAFFIHDLGYFGKSNMDGVEGEEHVKFGALVMGTLFGKKWGDLCLFHSRFFAKKHGRNVSRLCIADKLSICLTPAWLYLPMATWSGEINEYMALADSRTKAGEPKYAGMTTYSDCEKQWYSDMQEYLRRWVQVHKDGRMDTWTPCVNYPALKGGACEDKFLC